VQTGTPLFVLQELAGWETERMARRYAHFTANHLAVYADKLEILEQTRHDNRISAAQRCQHVKKQNSSDVPTRHADFRPHVECSGKLLILRCSNGLHGKC
jgi:hypothetical protein